MGGVGFSIEVVASGATPPDSKGLYEAMYELVEANVRKVAKGKPYAQVTDDFLSIAREDGWGAKDEISFGFRDAAGMCQMSADACCHWYGLLVAALREKGVLDPLAASYGLRLRWKRPKALKALLARCDEPLVEVRGNLFSTGKLDGEIYITSDDLGDETITIDDLSAKERAKVVAAFTKKKCACSVCAALRGRVELVLPKPVKAPKRPKPKAAKSKKIGASLYVNDAECTSLDPAILRGKIDGLRVNAPITDLPAELEKLPISWVSLKTKITHVPDVLSRCASLRYFSLEENPLASLGELAKLPQLRRIVIERWPGVPVADIPFDALPNLEELWVQHCDLRTLPPLPARLKRLELAGNAFETFPAAVMRVTDLERLDLSENPLKELPRSWASLPRLASLNLYGTSITEIGEGLDALEELSVGSTKIDRLRVSKMKSLRELQACDMPLREIDALPGKLESLNVSRTSIGAFPNVRAAKKSLATLQLQNNAGVEDLPSWLGELEALETLHLGKLAVKELPESMQNLRGLRRLSMRGMNVFPLPDWFEKLKLDELQLDKDDLPRGEAKRLKGLLPKTKIRL